MTQYYIMTVYHISTISTAVPHHDSSLMSPLSSPVTRPWRGCRWDEVHEIEEAALPDFFGATQ